MTSINSMIFMIIKIDILMLIRLIDTADFALIRYKLELWNSCSAGILRPFDPSTVLKIIIYLNDVSEDYGLFQYIPKSLTSKISDSLKYTSGYIQDKIMQGVISSKFINHVQELLVQSSLPRLLIFFIVVSHL